jgi:MFS family permease
MVLAISDFTIADAVIPALARDLDLSVDDLGLAFTAYFATAAAFMILFGRLGDVIGRRRVMLVAVVWFIAGSLVSGLAWNVPSFFAGRVLAGLALAAILPAGLGMLHALYPSPGTTRERAFALWAMAIGAAAVFGPLVGGAAAATTISWRWAFLGAVPFGLIAAVGIRMLVPENDRRRLAGIDIVGALLVAVVAGSVALAVDIGVGQGGVAPAGVLVCVGVVAMAAFVAVERRRVRQGRDVVAPPGLLRLRSFRVATVSSAFMSVGDTGFQLVLPVVVGIVVGASEFGVGAVLACYGAGVLVGGPIAAWLSSHLDDRLVAKLALAVLPLLLLALLPLLAKDAPITGIAGLLAAYGVAWGVAYARLVNLSYQEVPEHDSAVAGGVQSAMRLLAGALGAAILTAVFGGVAASRVAGAEDLDPATRNAVSHQADPSDAIPSHQRLVPIPHEFRDDGTPAVHAIQNAYTAGARAAIVVAAGITALGLVTALRIPKSIPPQIRS